MDSSKCIMCDGILDSENHNCFKSITSRLNRHRNDLNLLIGRDTNISQQMRNLDLKFKEIDPKINDTQLETCQATLSTLENRLNDISKKNFEDRISIIDQRLTLLQVSVPKLVHQTRQNLSEEITRIRDETTSLNKQIQEVSTEAKAMFLAKKTLDEASANATSIQKREEGEIDASQRSSSLSDMEVTVVENQLPRGSHTTLIPTRRTFNAGSSYYRIPRKPRRTPTPEDEFTITSNNVRTQSHGPNELTTVIVDYGQQSHMIHVPKTLTCKQLRARVRKDLNIDPQQTLNLVHVQHRVIENDDRQLWKLGMRNIPNHIALLPDTIRPGDQLVFNYKNKGPNVNGTYQNP